MILEEHWDCDPDALICPVMACVVCGRYVGPDDLWGTFTWNDDDGRPAMTPTIGYHFGRCYLKLEAAAKQLDASAGDMTVRYRLECFDHNVAHPLRRGDDGLIRRRRYRIDLLRIHELLTLVRSPLLEGDPE